MSVNKVESIYSEIEASLSQTEKLHLIQKVISGLLPSKIDLDSVQSQTSPRIPGLHLGNAWISDDFDEPLSDEFWLGQQESNSKSVMLKSDYESLNKITLIQPEVK